MSASDPSSQSSWAIYARLLAYVKPLRIFFFVSILGNAIYAAASAGMAKALDYVIQTVENPTDEGRLLLPALIVGLFALRGLGGFLGGYFIAYVGRNVVHALRVELFDSYLRLPASYIDSQSSGHLVSRVTFNIEQVAQTSTSAVTVIVREGLTVLGLIALLLYENWRLTLIFLALGPFIGIVLSYASKRFRKLSKRLMSSMGDVTHIVSEVVSGFRVVRVFGGEDYEADRFKQASEYNKNQSLKMELTKAVSTPVIQILVALAVAILVWLALAPEVRGDMTAGSFVVIIAAAATMAKPIRQLTQVNETIQKGLTAARDVFATMSRTPERNAGTKVASGIKGHIQVKNIHFQYEASDKAVLRGINLDIKPGETVAIVGRSGSGKSTLANLIPRFYEISEGHIFLDGVELRDYELKSLRANIALVTQHVTLFNDTIERNIAYGLLSDSDADSLMAATQQAHALDFIEDKENGLRTVIGDNGLTLSGGQRQRLAIARAILKDAPILILDEATSALDNESERHIQLELEQLMKGRTTIVIAHRLSTIENADKIVVMDDGQIIEEGTHQALLKRQGEYARLYSIQFEESDL